MLRYWETEFSFLAPDKSSSGQRVYSERDLELIGRIKELLYDEGYTIAGAKKRLESELDGSVAEASEDDAGTEDVESEESGEVAEAPSDDGEDSTPSEQVDTRLAERVETLEAGVRDALEEVRNLLGELDSAR